MHIPRCFLHNEWSKAGSSCLAENFQETGKVELSLYKSDTTADIGLCTLSRCTQNLPESCGNFCEIPDSVFLFLGVKLCIDTVDGRNPAPVDMVNIPLFTRFYTSQVVQDFFHQRYVLIVAWNTCFHCCKPRFPQLLCPISLGVAPSSRMCKELRRWIPLWKVFRVYKKRKTAQKQTKSEKCLESTKKCPKKINNKQIVLTMLALHRKAIEIIGDRGISSCWLVPD